MKKQKVFYTSPEVEILELRVENLICASGEIGINGFGNDDDVLNSSTMDFFDFCSLL